MRSPTGNKPIPIPLPILKPIPLLIRLRPHPLRTPESIPKKLALVNLAPRIGLSLDRSVPIMLLIVDAVIARLLEGDGLVVAALDPYSVVVYLDVVAGNFVDVGANVHGAEFSGRLWMSLWNWAKSY